MKRISLFIVSNLLVMLLLSVTTRLLGVDRYLTAHGLGLPALLGFSLALGVGGSFLSLLMSKRFARWTLDMVVLRHDAMPRDKFLLSTVKKYAAQAGIAMPQVAVYLGPPNAFATGPSKNSALVAVSTGLLEVMPESELEAVLAHEVAHIANGDMVTLTLVQGVLNTFVVLLSRLASYALDGIFRRDEDLDLRPGWAYASTRFLLELLLGLGASVVVAWFSRRREFRADAEATRLLGDKRPMIQALAHLRELKIAPMPKSLAAMGIAGGLGKWWATHPPLDERIARLKAL